MLLEVNCSVEHFMDFLNNAEKAGVKPDFDMHGADENSSFGSVADVTAPEPEDDTMDIKDEVIDDV